MIPTPDKDKTVGEDTAEIPAALKPDLLTKLGRYRIVRELGRGGFGVVYLAHDPKIGRDVAIKTILTSELRQPGNEQLFQRLYREAQSAGVLSHPGLVTVYELEEDHDVTYIVMQYVNGPNLRDLMAAPQRLPSERIVDILQQTAAALDFAHAKNVVHRDVKPANIMLDEDGSVKITDFGVAKILGAVTQTQTTSTVGTPFYMAPEQIRLGEVSGRTDQFALAVIAYEMLTGHRPFNGDSLPSLIHQILSVDPPRADTVNVEVPGPVGEVLHQALSKEPSDRYPTCLAFVKELRGALLEGEEPALARTLRLSELRPNPATQDLAKQPTQELTRDNTQGVLKPRARWHYWAGGIFVALFLVAMPFVVRYALDYKRINARPEATFLRVAHQSGQIAFPSLSPDVTRLAYASRTEGRFDIVAQEVRSDDSLNPQRTNLTDNPAEDTQPAFSPDGKWIVFRSDRDNGGIFVMDAQGRNLRRLVDRGYNPTWSPDGQRICFASEGVSRPEDRSTANSRLSVVDVATGERSRLYDGDAVQPAWSPHGQRIAFWFVHDGTRDLATIPAAGGSPVSVTNDAAMDWSPAWSPDGKYLYFSSDRGGRMNLWRVPIDEATGKALGEPQPLREPGVDTAYVQFAKDGKRFAFVQRTFTSSIYRAAFDPERGEIAGKPAAITQGQLASRPDVSADGKRIVFESTIDKDEDLYSMDINGGGYRPLMQDPDKDRGPRWSPDGKRVAFFSTHSGTWQIWLSDADGQHQRQVTNRANSIYPVWSPAGDRLITTVMANTPADYQSFVIKLLPDLRVESMQSLPPLGDPNESFTPWSWSPDGRSLAGYRQGLDGRVTGITIFDFQSQKYNPVTTFGSEPVWLHHSPRLLFLHQGKIYLLDVRDPARAKVALSLAPNDIARRGFGVSNDDRTIVFGLEEVQSDLWLGKLKDPQNPPGGN